MRRRVSEGAAVLSVDTDTVPVVHDGDLDGAMGERRRRESRVDDFDLRIKERRQGIKASRHQGIKASRHQDTKASRHQGIKASRHQGNNERPTTPHLWPDIVVLAQSRGVREDQMRPSLARNELEVSASVAALIRNVKVYARGAGTRARDPRTVDLDNERVLCLGESAISRNDA